MAFSIPKTIYPSFTLSHDKIGSVEVGTAIKDLPPGTITEMKKRHEKATIIAKERFEIAQKEYEKDFQNASIKAEKASTLIGGTRLKKAIAITLLVASIITAVGVTLASIATGTWPLLFVALPLFVGIAPTSYFTHIFRHQTSKLEKQIEAPERLAKPQLNLPIYKEEKDLDLYQSRINAQNNLSRMTLDGIAHSGLSDEKIVSYALLDKVTDINKKKKPAFYAKTIQLANTQRNNNEEYFKLKAKANSEFHRLNSELESWKSTQETHISSQEWTNFNHDLTTARYHYGRPPYRDNLFLVSAPTSILSHWDLEQQKTELATNVARRKNEINNWHQSTLIAIETAFNEAVENINQQYQEAKKTARA